jgi:rare lipoprotein A
MSATQRARFCLAGLSLTAGFALPAHALASPSAGGTASPSSAAPGGALGGATPLAPMGLNTLTAPPEGVIVRRPATLRGQLTPAEAGGIVLIQLLDPRRGWATVARTTARRDGSFTTSWRAGHIGRFRMRAIAAGGASASALSSTPATAIVDVLRPVVATFFGPGMYGSKTACGETLTPELLGVAHRWLPCGTQVHIAYRGRSITVPVVDRGPYSAGVSYDLTAATATALGIDGTVQIGALALKP